jgi:hypothetical protein
MKRKKQNPDVVQNEGVVEQDGREGRSGLHAFSWRFGLRMAFFDLGVGVETRTFRVCRRDTRDERKSRKERLAVGGLGTRVIP